MFFSMLIDLEFSLGFLVNNRSNWVKQVYRRNWLNFEWFETFFKNWARAKFELFERSMTIVSALMCFWTILRARELRWAYIEAYMISWVFWLAEMIPNDLNWSFLQRYSKKFFSDVLERIHLNSCECQTKFSLSKEELK